MRITTRLSPLVLIWATVLSLGQSNVQAGGYTRKLRSPAIVSGLIGGESHHSYVIFVRKGQSLSVQISWRRERDADTGDNHAEFFVGALPDFNGGGTVKFGTESDYGTRWNGKVPRSGKYYIYVMAHPWAHYTLRVTTK